MTTDKKDSVEQLMYSYSTDINRIEDENRLLKETINQLNIELEQFRRPPLMVCEIKEMFKKENKAVIKIPNGNEFYVDIAASCKKVRAGDNVLVDQKNLTIIQPVNISKKFNVEKFVIIDHPKTQWNEIGGLDRQIEEIKEVIELPLKKPELFKKVGITPPKGILLYGPPGTGKTLLAKAVASSSHATFIEIVGSELVQKFIGEGAKLVKEVFNLARNKSPSIVFIDEIDAIAAKRIEIGTSGEREVQRTFMQFLAEIDGFDNLGDVKIIGCTNRKDILDPAILRPGRLDRLIKIPTPTSQGQKQILNIHSAMMKLDKNVNFDTLLPIMDGFSGAEIKAVCTEAGYFAIRKSRFKICQDDLIKAVHKVKQEEKDDSDYLQMFG